MLKSIVASGLFLVVGVAPALAQPKLEVDGYYGWTFSDGVSGSTYVVPGSGSYNRIDPKDSSSLGFSVGVLVGEEGRGEVGFMYGHQFSNMVLGGTAGTTDKELGSWGVNSYHGYFGYNFAEHDAKIIPFFYGGLGASNYSEEDVMLAGVAHNISGTTKFSTTWGGGIKYMANPKVGIRIAGSWTPTYIKSDTAGWWCDPYWGCYLVGNAQYSNQLTISGGVALRFP